MRLNLLLLLVIVLTAATVVVSQTSRGDGINLYRSGDFKAAAVVLKAATQANKSDYFGWVYLGASLYRDGQAKEAMAAFRRGKAKAEEIVPGDESPVSSFVKPRPRYTEMARQNLTTGVVKLAVELAPDGKVGFIFPIQTLPDGLTEQSISAARNITFVPAVSKGKPVRTVAIVEYRFDIY